MDIKNYLGLPTPQISTQLRMLGNFSKKTSETKKEWGMIPQETLDERIYSIESHYRCCQWEAFGLLWRYDSTRELSFLPSGMIGRFTSVWETRLSVVVETQLGAAMRKWSHGVSRATLYGILAERVTLFCRGD
ncbi:hypothetical protein HOY82DRAFT_616465 [Tuber indicum]|nr:hypothetical protein HOY82DRAFT_616465 [Tuber indicum]